MSLSRPTYTLLPLLFVSHLACAELTEPGSGTRAQATNTEAAVPSPRPVAAEDGRITAAHILLAYSGARRSNATRSKEEARKLAEDVLRKARAGGDFGALAQQYTDDSSGKTRGGALGSFDKNQMVKPFSDAAFALKPGQISGIVETDFGFHIIKRTE